MTLKDRIINEFLSDDKRNFTVYQTTFSELSQMYDKVVASVKNGEKFERFLNFEKAINSEGRIRFDREVDFLDKETKKNIITPIVFKFAVYSYLRNAYTQAMADIKQKEEDSFKNLIPN